MIAGNSFSLSGSNERDVGEIAEFPPGFFQNDRAERLTLHIDRQITKGFGEVGTTHFYHCVF